MHIDWSAFTPWSAAIGGVIIGAAVAIFALVNGRIAGISGIVGGLFRPAAGGVGWRLGFFAGLMAGPILYALVATSPPGVVGARCPALIVAGVLGGVRTR